MKIAVIGGGAAGFFAAIQAKTHHPQASVTILEKSKKLLAKVKVSGGGRCNVTNGCKTIRELSDGYPRGGKELKKLFREFDNWATRDWFEARGVKLKTEADNRVFPVSDSSQSVIDCLMKEIRRLGVEIKDGAHVQSIQQHSGQWALHIARVDRPLICDKVIIASGGSPTKKGLAWLAAFGHEIEEPVPSLFTFNMPQNPITQLMGVSVDQALVSIQGTKLKASGPLLITHWGMSGPAILKLSAFGARVLSDLHYRFQAHVNWVNEPNHDQAAHQLSLLLDAHPQKQLSNVRPFSLPERLWAFLVAKAELSPTKKCGELGKKGLNKLVQILTHDIYSVEGKTTFKEEFVTCGGISLESVDIETMQSKSCRGIYFAGEVLDIDGITGGYNFQAAWTTAFVAGRLG